MKYIFVDTNLLIHYQPIEELDWSKIVSGKDFTILIPLKVVRELDNHKHSHKNFVQKQSRKILPKLYKYLDDKSNLPENLDIKILEEDPPENVFKNNNLNTNINDDDEIIASIIHYRSTNDIDDISLITADYGMLLKARNYNINAVKIPDKYSLPSSESTEEKKIRKLENEVRKLKSTFPDVDLFLKEKKKFDLFYVHKYCQFDEKYLDKKINKLKANFPKISPSDSKIKIYSPSQIAEVHLNAGKSGLRKTSKKYNQELEKFYEEYRNYIEQKIYYLQCQRRSFNLKLQVCNDGSAPAEDIDITLHFPDGFKIFDSYDSPIQNPSKPNPPTRDIRMGLGNQPIVASRLNTPNYTRNIPNVGGLNIKETNSFKVKTHIRKIKHNQSVKIDPITIFFRESDEVKGFPIKYKILMGNYPVPVNGELNVNIKTH